MINGFAKVIINVCKILNTHNVDYLVIGGTATALHGYYRLSTDSAGLKTTKPDLDFWYNPTFTNYFNLLNALEELGIDVIKFKKEKAPQPKKSFFKFDFEEYSMDLLPRVKADIKFRDAFSRRTLVRIDNIDISCIGYEDLVADKISNGRPKDLEDLNQLKKKRKP